MVGERPLNSRPCLVVTCHVEKSRKRLIKMLEKDSTISHSGFEVLGRCGNLRFKTDRDGGKGSRGSFDWPSTVEQAGLGLACGLIVTNYPPGSGCETLQATLGGLLVLGSHYVALTVAHVLVNNGVAKPYPHDCTEDDTVIDSPGQRRNRRNSSGSRSRSSHERDCVRVDACCYIDDETGSCLDVALDAEGNTAVSHTLDWALLEIPPGFAITQYTNCTVWRGETLRVKRVARCDPENEEVLILRQEDWPMRAFCSGTPSIISCGRFMGLAFTIQAIKGEEEFQSGVSGSWVINQSTGDLYGIVVAGFEGDDDEVYMVRASDVFADIARTCGVEPKFPLRSSDETETARAVSGLDNHRHTALDRFTTLGGSREASAWATDVETSNTDVSRQLKELNSFFTRQRLDDINEFAAPLLE